MLLPWWYGVQPWGAVLGRRIATAGPPSGKGARGSAWVVQLAGAAFQGPGGVDAPVGLRKPMEEEDGAAIGRAWDA